MAWLAGLGMDKDSVRRGWNRCKRQIAAFPKAQQDVLLETSGNSRLVVEGSCHAALMFGSLAPNVARSDVMVLAESLLRLTSPDGDSVPMASRCRAATIGDPDDSPWQQGYALAEELQNDLDGCVDHERVDVEAILERLGVDVAEAESVRPIRSGGGDRRTPPSQWNRLEPQQSLQRRLRGGLASRSPTSSATFCSIASVGQRLAVASGPWAPPSLERRANAFAAMLLMPTEAVRTVVAGMNEPISTGQGISTVADRLHTGFSTTLWHLRNLGFVDNTSRQRIETERQRL